MKTINSITYVNIKSNLLLANMVYLAKISEGLDCKVVISEKDITVAWNEKVQDINPLQECFKALKNNIENDNMVYLPNAYNDVKNFVNPKQWSGYLSALTIAGFYKPVDKFWGEVVKKVEINKDIIHNYNV